LRYDPGAVKKIDSSFGLAGCPGSGKPCRYHDLAEDVRGRDCEKNNPLFRSGMAVFLVVVQLIPVNLSQCKLAKYCKKS
jgi:hypothetical protein